MFIKQAWLIIRFAKTDEILYKSLDNFIYYFYFFLYIVSERRDLIDAISKISDGLDKELKPLIQKLAKNIGDNIKHPEIINMCKILGIADPELKDVSSILQRLRKTHNWSFSRNSVIRCVQVEYKRDYDGVEKKEGYENPVRINDNMISEENFEKIESLLKKYKKSITPAKDIITKARKEDMENYTWKCHVANELALLAIKMENDHETKHQEELCKEYAKRAKMVRDSRFATDANSYEAIILACNSTQSLKNSIKGEWEFKTVWEVKNDEDKCRECIRDQCRATNCNHECHRVVRPMTTKGLKYAIKTNKDLADLDNHVKRLTTIDNDICRIGKMLLENPKTKKLLGSTDIKKLIFSHIDKDECLQCDLWIEKHPNFYEDLK